MRIAFLISTFPKLSETFILNQIIGLLNAGHEVSIFAQRHSETPKQHAVVDEHALLDRTVFTNAPDNYREAVLLITELLRNHPNVNTISHIIESIARGKTGAERLANFQTLLDYPDLNEFDIIHGHFGTTCRSFDFLASNNRFDVGDGVPFVSSFYGYDVSEVLRRNPDAYVNLFPLCDAVTTLSDDMTEKMIDAGCPPEKLVKQQLAIDTTQYRFHRRQRSKRDPFNLLTVSRFTEKKGISYAVDAVTRLTDDYDIRYRIAGDGPLRKQLERQVAQRGIEDSVEFLGWISQDIVRRELANAHGFLLPSVTASNGDQEGTPTALLEAQASGLPVISTYHAGIPEIVADGESGYLVPERDVDALTQALEQLFQSESEWTQMGRRGRELVRSSHSIPVMTDRLESLYNNI